MLENEPGDLAGRITAFLVDLVQQVEGIREHVPRPARRITHREVLWGIDGERGIGGGIRIRHGSRIRRGSRACFATLAARAGLDVVLPRLVQLAVGVGLRPQPAHRVLHEVAHDPVRREQLGGGGNLVLAGLVVLLESFHHLVFAFRDIELVQPADDLHVARLARAAADAARQAIHRATSLGVADLGSAVLGGHRLHGVAQHGAFRQQIRGHEQLVRLALVRTATRPFEHERHHAMPVAAFGLEQQAICSSLRIHRLLRAARLRCTCGLRGAVEQRLDLLAHLLATGHRERILVVLAALGGGKQLRQGDRAHQIRRGDHGYAGEAMHIHVAQGDDAVEPTVGVAFHQCIVCLRVVAAACLSFVHQLALEVCHGAGAVDASARVRGKRGIEPRCHGAHELAARLLCECLKFGGVHSKILPPLWMTFSNSWQYASRYSLTSFSLTSTVRSK